MYLSCVPRLSSLVAIVTLLTQSTTADDLLSRDGLTATDISMRLKDVYAATHSYLDTGLVKEVFIDANGKRVIQKPFTTAFVRPDRFRYEFRDKSPYLAERRLVIYRNGNELRTHWDVEHALELDTLDRVIAAATDVSSESAITLPGMLLPDEITWPRAIRFRKPIRIADEKQATWIATASLDRAGDGRITFWISKQDSLLRKTYLEQSFDDFRVQRTTTYKPVMDAEIDPNFLKF